MNNNKPPEIIAKIIQNKKVEENYSWNPNDKYYCENEDKKLINSYTKQNRPLTDNDFNEFYKELYVLLKNRYHNKFYPEVMNRQNRLEYKLRGQAIIDDIPLDLIVKYTVKATSSHITFNVDFITKRQQRYFEQEKKYIKNYSTEKVEENKGILDKISNFFKKEDKKDEIVDDEIIIPNFNINFTNKGYKNKYKKRTKNYIHESFKILFNNYQFNSAIKLLDFMNLNSQEYNALKYFLEFYKDWDCLNYTQTPDILVTFFETELISPLVPQFNKNKSVIRSLRKENDYSFLVIDLINNARRRFEQELYNDSIIRLYRSLELISHVQLTSEYDINPSNINISKVQEYNVPKTEIYHLKSLARNNITTLGMKEQYRLLSLLRNPLGKFFYENREIYEEIINMRNTSLLIHGYTNLSSLQYQQYEYMTIQLASHSIKDFPRYFKDAKFPKYNLENTY